MNFYLTQVMSGHREFNACLFRMKLVGSFDCFNCDRRGRDDDAWHTLLECPAFQLYREDAMTTLQEMGEQPLIPDSLVPIMLKGRRMRPSGHFCRFDNVPQDGDSAKVAKAGHSCHHPAPNAGPRHPPFCY